jgi:hypothetical protein
MFIKNLIAALVGLSFLTSCGSGEYLKSQKVGIWSAEVWVDAAIVANAKTSFSLN